MSVAVVVAIAVGARVLWHLVSPSKCASERGAETVPEGLAIPQQGQQHGIAKWMACMDVSLPKPGNRKSHEYKEEMQRRVIPLITGILFVALVVVSIFTGPGGSATNSNANPANTLAYFQAPHAHYAGLSALLITLAVTIGLFFFASVRDYLRRDEAQASLAGTAFGGAIIFGASGALSAGALLAISDSPKTLLPATAQMLNLIQNDVSNGMQAAGLAVFFLAVGIAVIRSRLLPLWWGWSPSSSAWSPLRSSSRSPRSSEWACGRSSPRS